ncbi:MAG: hypothetical protein HUN04_02670 [Desulfobacter sp.]|nr:MAG: hypothetical protein HUN04_02670 [Desulfobacter sp.]
MAQKITLSIPDMLHEKLTEWRSSFNFSKMFQEALTEAIQKKEELQKRFSEELDMPDIVKRLRQEKLDWENRFYRSGKKQGLKWAKSAHYQDLLYVLHCEDTYELLNHEDYQSYFNGIYKANGLGSYTSQEGVDHEKKFIDGWFDGVTSFWNEVRNQL